MTQVILESYRTRAVKRGSRIFVVCGAIHSVGYEGILRSSLTQSGLKFVSLGSTEVERINYKPSEKSFQNQGESRRTLKSLSKMTAVNKALRKLGLPPDIQPVGQLKELTLTLPD